MPVVLAPCPAFARLIPTSAVTMIAFILVFIPAMKHGMTLV